MRFSTHSHCNGINRVPPRTKEEIEVAIASVQVRPERGATTRIREAIISSLMSHGWSSEVPVAKNSDMTITSMKESVGLCLQTGNMARMYADLMKLQTLYLDNSISAAALILPSQPLALVLGDNIAHSLRLERELEIFRKVFHVPALIFGLE